MTTATAIANPNLAFIRYRLAKLGRTNGAGGLGAGNITGGTALCRENQDKTDRMRAKAGQALWLAPPDFSTTILGNNFLGQNG